VADPAVDRRGLVQEFACAISVAPSVRFDRGADDSGVDAPPKDSALCRRRHSFHGLAAR
jgi:hypothetical protein